MSLRPFFFYPHTTLALDSRVFIHPDVFPWILWMRERQEAHFHLHMPLSLISRGGYSVMKTAPGCAPHTSSPKKDMEAKNRKSTLNRNCDCIALFCPHKDHRSVKRIISKHRNEKTIHQRCSPWIIGHHRQYKSYWLSLSVGQDLHQVIPRPLDAYHEVQQSLYCGLIDTKVFFFLATWEAWFNVV